jgi:hypothetical protein
MTGNLHRVLVIIVVICIVVIFLIIFAVQSSSSPSAGRQLITQRTLRSTSRGCTRMFATEAFSQTEARMVHRVPVFDIFSGRFGEKDAVWLGAAVALAAARDAMLRFAAKSPGAYFVCSSDSRAVVASVDTTLKAKAKGAA